MQVSLYAQSPSSISVSWQTEAGDPVFSPNSVVINEYDPSGKLIETQTNLPPDFGSTLFTKNLQPSTQYTYIWSALVATESGEAPFQLPPQKQTTKSKSGASSGGSQPSGGQTGSVQPYPGAVQNVQAQAKPFGRIVVTWNLTGDWAKQLTVQRNQINSPTGINATAVPYNVQNYGQPQGNAGVDQSPDGFTNSGPFVIGAEYSYTAISTNGQQTASVSAPNPVIYPGIFGLKEYLPPGFDPSQGVKRLRPNDHPYVSIRTIMSST